MGPVICNNFTVKWHFEPLFTSSRISTCFNLAILDNPAAFEHFFYSIVVCSSEASPANRKSEAYYRSADGNISWIIIIPATMLPRGADIARHKESLVATKAESTHRMGAQQNKDDIHKITSI